jgi:hypothetical protein
MEQIISQQVLLNYLNVKELAVLRLVSISIQQNTKDTFFERASFLITCDNTNDIPAAKHFRISEFYGGSCDDDDDDDKEEKYDELYECLYNKIENISFFIITDISKVTSTDTISSLTLKTGYFACSKKELVIPPNIDTLIIKDDTFDRSLENLPSSLKHLTIFSGSFSGTLDNLPSGLISLKAYVDIPSLNNLPKTLEYLEFNSKISTYIGDLPSSIKEIKFGYNFNRKVDNLPKFVKILRFGMGFNQCVDHLPENVTHIYFDTLFNQPINNLPQSVRLLSLGYSFDQTLMNIPKSVKTVMFPDGRACLLEDLNDTVTNLYINRSKICDELLQRLEKNNVKIHDRIFY